VVYKISVGCRGKPDRSARLKLGPARVAAVMALIRKKGLAGFTRLPRQLPPGAMNPTTGFWNAPAPARRNYIVHRQHQTVSRNVWHRPAWLCPDGSSTSSCLPWPPGTLKKLSLTAVQRLARTTSQPGAARVRVSPAIEIWGRRVAKEYVEERSGGLYVAGTPGFRSPRSSSTSVKGRQ